MTQDIAFKIEVNEKLCSGCQICQLKCSYIRDKVFNPNRAFIQISVNDVIPTIQFLDGCTQCGQCVKHCSYGALKLRRSE
ncbi:MAG: 4Fe-4S dicluster domain-containing protein [Candidatus Helarchaeota archaeon]